MSNKKVWVLAALVLQFAVGYPILSGDLYVWCGKLGNIANIDGGLLFLIFGIVGYVLVLAFTVVALCKVFGLPRSRRS